jgi:hypothetical protein
MVFVVLFFSWGAAARAGGPFVDNSDGTVSDTGTGLMWQKTDEGVQRSWENVPQYCEALGLAGYDDWRAPRIDELTTIVDYSQIDPALDTAFQGRSSYYWSGSEDAGNADAAWRVDFREGIVITGQKHETHYIRCVRGGPFWSLDPAEYLVIETSKTVRDTRTKLLWQKSALGIERTWSQAQAYCEQLSLEGNDDWRLPTIEELVTIIDYTASTPAISTEIFGEQTVNHYWSSTKHVNQPDFGWTVYGPFGRVQTNATDFPGFVRCVRTVFHVSVSPAAISGTAPLQVTFSATVSGGTEPYSYSWSFGDGETSTEESPSHTYRSPGTYTATVTVTDTAGRTAEGSADVTIESTSVPDAPVINVAVNGTVVTFSWSSVPGAAGYTFFYAPYPAAGHIGSLDLGLMTGSSVELWPGAAFYVALQAYNSAGSSNFSNIEYFIIGSASQ